jgi:hypothetical protein
MFSRAPRSAPPVPIVIGMTNDQILAKVRALMQVEADALAAIDDALRLVRHPEVAEHLGWFRTDHVRHLQDLLEGARVVLGVIVEIPLPDPDSMVTLGRADDTRKALCSLRMAKWVTTRVYGGASAAVGLPAAFLDVIERHHRDENRHLAWLNEAIARRCWERGSAAAAASRLASGPDRRGPAQRDG